MELLPDEIHLNFLSKFITFRDLGNLIKTSKLLKNIYDSTELWKKIYLMTCPDKWEFTKDSKHIDYSNKILNLSKLITNSYQNNEEINIHNYVHTLNIWNCQIKHECKNITHFNINTLKPKSIRNYDYKHRMMNINHGKACSRLRHKCDNIIFLNQLILPNRLEWYDIVGGYCICGARYINR
tara:strand:+ start:739 stop:1284 length:546 start_codon:yes stop_codon:yes gene_type:complete